MVCLPGKHVRRDRHCFGTILQYEVATGDSRFGESLIPRSEFIHVPVQVLNPDSPGHRTLLVVTY
jgi:hypothetical protein